MAHKRRGDWEDLLPAAPVDPVVPRSRRTRGATDARGLPFPTGTYSTVPSTRASLPFLITLKVTASSSS
jgi:hypothetical protein